MERLIHKIRNAHKLLNMLFTYTVIENYIVKNPCIGFKPNQYKEEIIENKFGDDFDDKLADEGEIETFTDSEIPLLLKGIKNKKLRIMVKLERALWN